MPGVNGLEAARTVLSRLPGCKVIFVTAYGLFQYTYEAMRLGACGYILKPVVPDEAEGAIRRVLGQIEAERRLTAMAPAAVGTDPADDDLPNTQMGQLMAQVKKYLRENYMYELSLDSIGDILHISPAYLSTQFKKYLHVGFLDYLTEVRIQAACSKTEAPPVSRRLRVPALAAALVLCCAAVLSAAGATPTGTHKDDTPDPILRYAENQPEGYPTTEAAYAFADLVAQRTDGRAIGLTGLAWFDAGLRHFYTNSPVTRLEDLQGMKIRVAESSLMEAIVLQLGADPVRIPYDDVYSALAKQEIDGAENNWPSYDYTGHYEVVKYMLLDGHTRIPELMLASAEAMDKLADLDPEYPALVRQCAKEAGLLERDLWRQTEAASEEKMRKAGVTVTTLDEEELERFRQATAPIYDMYADQKALIRRILNAAPDGE